MCTVSFLSRPPSGGYLLAVNRDERPTRGEARGPVVERRGGKQVCFPRDPDAGGTWIGVDEDGASLCLLNGDREGRTGGAADAPSRGLLVLELLADLEPESVRRILERRLRRGAMREASFRLLLARPGNGKGGAELHRVEWNGKELRHDRPAAPHLEVSNGHDQAAVTAVRRAAFEERFGAASRRGLPVPGDLAAALADWHSSHSAENPAGSVYTVCMHHDVASTVSLSLVEVSREQVRLIYRPGQPCRHLPAHEQVLPRRCPRPA
jgi:hypothetical protein